MKIQQELDETKIVLHKTVCHLKGYLISCCLTSFCKRGSHLTPR
jgi:hypothetical protein